MKISALGCCLIDYLYADYDYQHPAFQKHLSTNSGDGGIIRGGLVFAEDLEAFAGKPFNELLEELVEESAAKTNIGGPAIISIIHVAQILYKEGIIPTFFGITGKDKEKILIQDYLKKIIIDTSFKVSESQRTPTTYVFNDRNALKGKGERSFINVIGAAGELYEKDIPDQLFDCDLFVLGGTALVPSLHEEIEILLGRAKKAGAITVVGTIFDFKNEKKNPRKRWPYGERNAYALTDLLVCDALEALRMSGSSNLESAVSWFMEVGVPAFIITHGAKDIIAWASSESIFGSHDLTYYPVCAYVDNILKDNPSLFKDTTGCGDNFLGGAIISIAQQRSASAGAKLELKDVVVWGGASGGLALLFHGGMFHEAHQGEKEELLIPIVNAYTNQLNSLKTKET